MATNIKGITVKIGGDTTDLKNALDKVNQQSHDLQSELRGVNSLLKFDKNNTTLLKQKFDILNASIDETKKKQQILNETMAQIEAGEVKVTEEQMRYLEREVVAVTNKLERLNDEMDAFGSVNAQKIANLGKSFEGAGQKVSDLGTKLSGVSAGAGAVLTGSTVLASNFQDSLAMVNTIADTSKVSLSDLGDQILQLSNDTGIGASEIAEATYNSISAGQDTADAINFVQNATTLAKAGFTDTASSIDVLTTTLNAYGMEASEVTKVSDMFINTQNLGKLTVGELASSIGGVIPSAKAMNVGLDQLCASYSIMTARGIATAESTTYLNSMINELGKGGTGVSKILKEETGKSFADLMGEGKSLGDVLQILKDNADKNGKSFIDLWSSSEAGKSAMTLLSDGVGTYNDMVDKMNNSTGATAIAFEKLQTPSLKAQKSINQLKNAGIELGTTILDSIAPAIDTVCNAVRDLTNWFTNLPTGVQQVIVIVLALVTALAPMLIMVGKVISSIGTIMTFAPKLVTGLKAVWGVLSANPIGVVITIIGLLIGAFINAYNTSDTFRQKVNNALKMVCDVAKSVVNTIVTFFTQTLPNGFNNCLNAVIGWANGVAKWFNSVLNTVKTFVVNFINAILNIITKIVEFRVKLIKAIGDAITGMITKAIEIAKTLASKIYNAIINTVQSISNFAQKVGSAMGTAIRNMVTTAINIAKELPSKLYNAIVNTINNISNFGRNLGSTMGTAIRNMVNNAINIAKTLPSQFTTIGRNVINGIINGITGSVGRLYTSIKNALSGLVNKAKSVLGIHSPSKVFANVIGKQIPAGVSQGIEANTDEAIQSVDEMAKELTARELAMDGATINRTLKTTFTSGDVVDTNVKVLGALKDIKDALGSLKVVLDSGELVGGIIDKIDDTLDAKNKQIVRGW